MKLGDFLSKNIFVVNKIIKSRAGATNIVTLKEQFDIYNYFKGLKTGSKMQRYYATAEAMRVSDSTVRKAVYEMEKNI